MPVQLITVFAQIFGVSTDRLLYSDDAAATAQDGEDAHTLKLRLGNALKTIEELKEENKGLKHKLKRLEKKVESVIKGLSN